VWNLPPLPHCLDSMLLNSGHDDFTSLSLIMLMPFL
jgi:hypothetical protein